MLYIPLIVRTPIRAGLYEFFCCLLNLHLMIRLVIVDKKDYQSIHGYGIILTMDLISFIFDVVRLPVLYMVRWFLVPIVMRRRLRGRPQFYPGWWAWCCPQNERILKVVYSIDIKLLCFTLSGLLAQHLNPAPEHLRQSPTDFKDFNHLKCLLFIVSTRLIFLSTTVVFVNIVIQRTNSVDA